MAVAKILQPLAVALCVFLGSRLTEHEGSASRGEFQVELVALFIVLAVALLGYVTLECKDQPRLQRSGSRQNLVPRSRTISVEGGVSRAI